MIKKIFNRLGIYKTYSSKVGDTGFKIPFFNKLGYANFNLAEPWMQLILKKIGTEKSVFLDVGVNVGQTLLRWKSEFPESEYIGVEPNTDCVYYVNKLISENNIKNAIILPVAFNINASLDFLYINSTDPSDSTASTVKGFRGEENRISMPIVIMPYSILSKKKFDIIKVDVEGGELNVIKSIFHDGPCEAIFICEILPVYKKENIERLKNQNEIEDILAKNEYSIFRILKGAKVGLEAVETIGIHDDLNACDYLFIPNNKVSAALEKFK